MDVQLTPDQQAIVRYVIETGRLTRPEDAVQEAMALWERRERARIELLASLEDAEASLARGEGRDITAKSIRQLADPLKQYVEEQVRAGGYGSASEYVRELVRADQKRKAEEQLEDVLLEALKSESIEVTPEMWEELHQTLRARAEARKNAGH